jgi:transcriptional regulator with XRE-family HTH domain
MTDSSSHSDDDRRRILGNFIRAHRERLPPPAKAAGRRRTPGLRREELADASGVGETWITWLEQGRGVSASAAAQARQAEALQ